MSLALSTSARSLVIAAVAGLAALGACSVRTSQAPAGAAPACCLAEGRHVASTHKVEALAGRRFTHAELWSALSPHLRTASVRTTRIGSSTQGRAIDALTFGTGATTVLLWSQMHGDESAATMALSDIVAWLAAPQVEHQELRRRIGERLTVVMVPMLNPDGAELFQRTNAAGVDINRDARRLVTPEARALKALRDSIDADYGFNLHDQNARTLAGRGGAQVGIALLAPAPDSSRRYTSTRSRARLLASMIARAVQQEIPGQVARYDDSFEPRAFGDLMQRWGTSTVLIESGALAGDPEKQRLRAINVVAILTALDAIATGSHLSADVSAYESLPQNARGAVDLLIRGATLVVPGAQPVAADMTLTYEDAVARLRPRIQEVGDLPGAIALDTIDADGLFLHPEGPALQEHGGHRWLRLEVPARITIRRGTSPASEVVRIIE